VPGTPQPFDPPTMDAFTNILQISSFLKTDCSPKKDPSLSKASSHTVGTYTSCETLVSSREAIIMRLRSTAISNKSKSKNKHTLPSCNSQSELFEDSISTIIADLELSLSRIDIEGINDFSFDGGLLARSNAHGDYDCDDGDDVSDLSSVDSYSVADSLRTEYVRAYWSKLTPSASKAD
jgi:hypothetical protein